MNKPQGLPLPLQISYESTIESTKLFHIDKNIKFLWNTKYHSLPTVIFPYNFLQDK